MKSIKKLGRLLGIFCAAAIVSTEAQTQSNIVTYPTAGETAFGRTAHRLMPLSDGRLILQGDVALPSAGTNTVEVYNPDTRKFQRVGHLLVTRWQDASAVMDDGRLLVVGGRTNNPSTDIIGTAEILDPISEVTVPTGSLNIARTTARAITLQDGRVLVYGGTPKDFTTATPLPSELYDPTTGQFTVCGALNFNRPVSQEFTSATLLQDGRVLVVGSGPSVSTGAETFDPATGTFQVTGAVLVRRTTHSATLLPDGRVVIIGGVSTALPNSLTNLVEVYDPNTGTFSALGTIQLPRRNHSATLLPDGKILVAGGWTGTSPIPPSTPNMEIFDPATGTSEYIGDMAVARADHRVAALSNGQVIITGGRTDGPFLRSAEIFDPLLLLRPEDLYAFYQEFANLTLENQQLWQFYNEATNVIWGLTVTNNNLQGQLEYANDALTNLQAQLDELEPNPFRMLSDSTLPRTRPFVFTLPDGRVAIQAGTILDSPFQRVISVFNPQTERITTVATNIDIRIGHMGNVLPDGRIIYSGGSIRHYPSGPDVITNSTEIFDGSTSNVVYGPSMVQPRMAGLSINLADGRLLMFGGRNAANTFLPQSEIYEPSNQVFRLSGVMPRQVLTPTATLLQDGRVFIFGYNTNMLAEAQMFDPVTETFSTLNGASAARSGHQASLLADGRVFISGGRTASGGILITTTEIFDPVTGTFTAGPSMLNPRFNFAATTLPDGKVLLVGGQTNIFSSFPGVGLADLYDPATSSFSSAGLMATNRFNHTIALLENGTVFITGGNSGVPPGYLIKSELYDPVTHVRTSAFGNLNLLIDDLEAEKDELTAQLASVQQQYINATNVIWGLSITNAQLQQELATCQSNKTILEFQIMGLTNQIGQLQGTVATLTAQNNALTNQVAQQQATINALTAQNNSLTNQVAQQAALIASLQAQNSALSNQVATLTQENQQLQTTIANVDAQVGVLEEAFQDEFGNPAFVLPGLTLEQQIQNLISAILDLNHGQRQALYHKLD